jgi:hypothetical protein
MEPVAIVGIVFVIVFTAAGLAATMYAVMKKDWPGEHRAWDKVFVRPHEGHY